MVLSHAEEAPEQQKHQDDRHDRWRSVRVSARRGVAKFGASADEAVRLVREAMGPDACGKLSGRQPPAEGGVEIVAMRHTDLRRHRQQRTGIHRRRPPPWWPSTAAWRPARRTADHARCDERVFLGKHPQPAVAGATAARPIVLTRLVTAGFSGQPKRTLLSGQPCCWKS
ncbi:hypothetical protein ACU4GD_04340 [Cupriavidus basilensis]